MMMCASQSTTDWLLGQTHMNAHLRVINPTLFKAAWIEAFEKVLSWWLFLFCFLFQFPGFGQVQLLQDTQKRVQAPANKSGSTSSRRQVRLSQAVWIRPNFRCVIGNVRIHWIRPEIKMRENLTIEGKQKSCRAWFVWRRIAKTRWTRVGIVTLDEITSGRRRKSVSWSSSFFHDCLSIWQRHKFVRQEQKFEN